MDNEPSLHDVFIDQACEVLHDAYEDAKNTIAGPSWDELSDVKRAALHVAVSTLLDWLDSRRL